MFDEHRNLHAAQYPFDALVAEVRASRPATIQVPNGPYLAVLLHELAQACARPMIVVAPSNRAARQLHESFASLADSRRGESSTLLPPLDVSPYAEASMDRNLAMQRVIAAGRVPTLRPGEVIVGSSIAWALLAPPEDLLVSLTMSVEVNEEIDPAALRAALVAGGYAPVGIVEDPGTFSVRGDVIDIFDPARELPLRIELYGDMVESIRAFDPDTQRSKHDETGFSLRPISDILLTDTSRAHARERLLELASSQSVPSNQLSSLLADVQTSNRFFGIEAIMPAFYPRMTPLLQRRHAQSLLVVVEPDDGRETLTTWLRSRRQEFEREVDDGRLVCPPDDFFASPASIFDEANAEVTVHPLAAFDVEDALAFPWVTNEDVVRVRKQINDANRFFEELREPLHGLMEHYGRIQFVCPTKASSNRMAHRLRSIGLEPRMRTDGLDLSKAAPPCVNVDVTIGTLTEGFRAPGRGIAVFTENELFGKTSRRSAREQVEDAVSIASFRDLEINDLVVHIDHGIAQYLGLQKIRVSEDVETEFLILQYADEQKLYVPIHRLGRVQKYVGSPSFGKLDKIGGQSWERTKARVRVQIESIAQELLQLYAERAAREGYAFSPPGDAFLDFEAAFPYEETPHQERAIDEIIGDMTSKRPMDRLLCGDVGFGKTEVAIRAAYKAVLDGRQVVVLVPTTVLADQHLKSFRARFEGTGATVEMVSRFRTKQEIASILSQLEEGEIQVVIGTHRLLNADVRFKDLGLLIVDEEQRFGVRHKERIKQLRANIDVLTMSATPIPRTLEMAMLGLRDLSVILTPPPGRMAVSTHLARFKHSTLREGIEREMERGGQVFFVHNRVETIHNIAGEIRQIVPTARVGVGHAQMAPEALEEVMHAFINHEYDVLVSTTIVESGIDIGNANTIFINRADTFGLSQLHQLRGRVGRSHNKAYCYLLVQDPGKLTPDAKRRLEVIQQHTDLGAGLQVAQHDLDLRGAGSLLGSSQSGHIESIGFELYSELLEETIRELRGEPQNEDYEPEVRVPVATFIPDDYVVDLKQRLGFYKRFSVARDIAEVQDTLEALEDRYGTAPDSVDALKEVILLKVGLKDIRAERLEATSQHVIIDLRKDTRLVPAKVMELIRQQNGRYNFKPPMRVIARLEGAESKAILAGCSRVMRELSTCVG